MSKKGEPVRYFKEQFEDEEVLMVFRKHPVVMRRGLVYAAVAILLGTIPSLIRPEFSWFFIGLGAGFLLAVIVFFPSWISWYYSVYIVTDQRLIQVKQKGMFHRSMVALNLDQIQMVNYEIGGFQETVLGFGTIMIQTLVGSLTIHEVHHPAKIQKKLLHTLRDLGYNAAALAPAMQGQPGAAVEEDE